MEPDQFEKYYDQFKHKIYNYLYYRSGRNAELAEDLTSEVFMKAFEKFHTYKPDSSFQSWIYAIAHNHLIDFFRKNKPTADIEPLENVLKSDADVTDVTQKRFAKEQIAEMIQILSPDERDMLLMRYHQDMSTKEIAEIVDKPDSTVRVTIHRSFAKLKKQFGYLAALFLSLFSVL